MQRVPFAGVARVLRIAGVAGLLLAPLPAQAQRERLTVRAEALGGTSITRPTGTITGDQYTQRMVQVTLAHRLLRDQGNTILLLGGLWRGVEAGLPRTRASLRADEAPDAPTALQVATADVMVLKTFDERHTLISVVRPGLYGDAFRVEGAAFLDRIVSPRTTVGAGLSYGSAYGKVLPIPVVHIVSRPSRRVLVDALLPARGDVWWMPSKGLDLGVNASLIGAQYGLTASQQVGGADALRLANATLGSQVRWAPRGSKWQLLADGGLTVLRRLEYARGGDLVADLAPGNVPYLRLGAQRLF